MNPLEWIKALLGKGIVEPVATYYTRKQELQHAQFEAELKAALAIGDRRAQLIREGLAADASWEIEQIRNSGHKDEWVLFLLSIPLVLVFIPKTQPAVLAGFAALETTPDWYRWLVMIVFSAIYGIRIWRRQQYDTE